MLVSVPKLGPRRVVAAEVSGNESTPVRARVEWRNARLAAMRARAANNAD